jgi:lactaldehyde reductase
MVCVDPNVIPVLSIVDAELMLSLPPSLTAATGMDALTHAIEGYITKGAWEMSDMFELKAIEMIAKHLPVVVKNPSDVVARDGMAVAQYIAGMGFSNVGLGLVHGMAHPLGAYYDIPHGVANALLLPIVMEYNTESSIAKYVDIARAMGIKVDHLSLSDAAKAAVDAVKNLAIEVGIPEKLQLLNVKEEDLERLSQSAFEDVCTPGNPREVQLSDILELYKKAF